MAAVNYRGVNLPTAGDDLLGGLGEAFASAGVITVAASVAAARLALESAQSAGATITPARPVYFNIGGIVYIADGAKVSGVWTLKPINEVEVDEQTSTTGWTGSVANGTVRASITSALPVRPYSRVAIVDANVYGSVSSGNVDVAIAAHGKLKLGRLSSGDAQSAGASLIVRIPAGVTPDIVAGVRGGGPSGGSVILSADARLNNMTVTAFPVTMAG